MKFYGEIGRFSTCMCLSFPFVSDSYKNFHLLKGLVHALYECNCIWREQTETYPTCGFGLCSMSTVYSSRFFFTSLNYELWILLSETPCLQIVSHTVWRMDRRNSPKYLDRGYMIYLIIIDNTLPVFREKKFGLLKSMEINLSSRLYA